MTCHRQQRRDADAKADLAAATAAVPRKIPLAHDSSIRSRDRLTVSIAAVGFTLFSQRESPHTHDRGALRRLGNNRETTMRKQICIALAGALWLAGAAAQSQAPV